MLCNLWLHSHRRPGPGNCLRSHRESRRHLPHHASGCAAPGGGRPARIGSALELRVPLQRRRRRTRNAFSTPRPPLFRRLALTHPHAWPNHYLLRCHDQISIAAAAATASTQKPELGSSTDSEKSELQQQQQWQQHRNLTDLHGSYRLPSVVNGS